LFGVNKQMFSLWDSYKDQCKANGIKPKKKKIFYETERAIKRTCARLHNNKKTLFLYKEIDDTFVYAVIVENDTVHPSILRKIDAEARLSFIQEKFGSADNTP